MTSPAPPHLPLKKALAAIILSILLVSGSSFLGILYFNHLKENRRNDSNNRIVAVVQTSPDAEGLKTVYITELLGLSIDHPTNLYAFSTKDALDRLLGSPVIKEAKITKISPGTIWVDYSLRKPLAILGDYSNTMIDREGVPFPGKPFFTPKRLPEIFLGRFDEDTVDDAGADKGLSWGTAIHGKRLRLALALLDFITNHCCSVTTYLERIDVSKAFSLSYGQRQIILVLKDSCEREINGRLVLCIHPRILRLDLDNYEQQLLRYLVLRSYLNKNDNPILSDTKESVFQADPTIVDLRIPDLAFMYVL